MTGRPADRYQSPRPRKGAQPFDLFQCRPGTTGGISNREGQLEQVGSQPPGILRGRDLKVEICQRVARVADVDKLRASSGLFTNVPAHGHASVTDANHEVRPWRLDQFTRFLCDDAEAPSKQGNSTRLIEM